MGYLMGEYSLEYQVHAGGSCSPLDGRPEDANAVIAIVRGENLVFLALLAEVVGDVYFELALVG